MRRAVFAFVLGVIAGAAAILFMDTRPELSDVQRSAGEAIEQAGRGANNLQLEARVRAALALHKDFSLFGGIGVQAQEGAITLTGKVASRDQRELAVLITRGVDGVDEVHNDLEIHDEN